jgi:hypothetical protein
MKSAIATDAQYLAAVKAGDTAKAQQMVNDAAKKAGYTIGPVYHASQNKFDVFLSKADQADQRGEEVEEYDVGNLGDGFYFTPDKTYASKYGAVRSFYLKIKNLVNLDDSKTLNRALEIESELEEDLGQVFPSDVYEALIDERKADGIVGKGVGGFSAGSIELMVKKSSQAKLADPVTYDKSGSVIPLSKRFNFQSSEITNPIVPENEGIPFEHTTTKIEKLEDADINKTSESSYLGQALYGVLEGGSWKPSHLKSGRTLRGTVSGRIIDLTNVTNEDLKRIGKLIGRDIETVPFLTLEKRYGGIGKGLLAAGYSAAIHMGAGAAGRHIAIFDTSKIKSADSSTSSEITNPAGRIPAQFPYEYAKYLKQHFPEIWKLGGNIRGNDAFRWWSAYRQGDRSPTVMRWWAVTRPAWIARHYRDHRIAGVVAQIKWGTIGTLGVSGMKRVIETKIRNSQ